ncbi:MAG: response regulator transcription factor [Gammaproteobacteria bacterium]|nr:response regulator transcription factor [Gammaproteobacteria bacterium]
MLAAHQFAESAGKPVAHEQRQGQRIASASTVPMNGRSDADHHAEHACAAPPLPMPRSRRKEAGRALDGARGRSRAADLGATPVAGSACDRGSPSGVMHLVSHLLRKTESSQILAMQRLIEPLTPRELEVLDLVCDGDSNLDISARLGISLSTVKYHVLQIYGKLGVARRTQAVAIGVHLKLVQPAWLFECPGPALSIEVASD